MTDTKQKPHAEHLHAGERHGLALPIELEEGAPPALANAAMAVVSGLIILLLVWANIAHVRELSVAPGTIAAYGSSRAAAHLEGGIVEEVLVSPGDVVAKGQALIVMNSESGGGEFNRMNARYASLGIRSERLSAQAENRNPDFSSMSTEWQNAITEQQTIFDAAVEQHRATIATLQAKEESAQSEVNRAKAERDAEVELLGYATEQLEIQESLIEEGYTSKQSYLKAKSAAASAKASSAAARSRLEQAHRAYASAKAERERSLAEYHNRIAEERADVIGELAELKEPMASLKDRSNRLTVRAPIAGIVNDVLVFGEGDVVRPGGTVAEITPTDAELMAEVRVNPKDIGHVFAGLKTDVSVTTFDPNRYGKIPGAVSHISADTFTDERSGEPYYIAYIALEQQIIGKGRQQRPISPGMQVRAEIVTQSRSFMRYILKPVARSVDRAFTER
ncbi:HlyD family type I secretion periplasmic adaptor subunit [Hyphococcus lacteus]|uniref:Membrane fusion protein (MFP) family protein n=1 Tax=Hyphococcus lacteus TaxID=3143536 RepID=A0ABV3Z468_9PROT